MNEGFTWPYPAVATGIGSMPGIDSREATNIVVGEIGAVKAATFHFLNPFFGVAIAAALLGEKLGALDVVGVVVIAAGILMVQLSKQKAAVG